MEVAVVGAGIIGLASAYYLADRGADVTVLEKSSIGAGSTDRANGGIRAQFTSPVSVALSKESIAVWETFEEEFGTDIEYRQTGYLFLARTEDTAAQLRENVRIQNEQGVSSRYLEPDAFDDLCDGLYADEFVGASYAATDGWADPHLGLQGFSQAATAAGAEIRTGVKVTDILQNNADEVVGVDTSADSIEADFVVNTAGSWAGKVAAMAGIDVPISPKRRQLLVAEPERPVPEDNPFVIDMDADTHFRPEREGAVVAGGHYTSEDPEKDPDRFRTQHDMDWAIEVAEHLTEIADFFGLDTKIRQGWAGLYAVTPDHHPVIEETIPGFVNACGFSGHGFMQAPATGQLVSELCFDGEATLLDISSLSNSRFEDGKLLKEGTVID